MTRQINQRRPMQAGRHHIKRVLPDGTTRVADCGYRSDQRRDFAWDWEDTICPACLGDVVDYSRDLLGHAMAIKREADNACPKRRRRKETDDE